MNELYADAVTEHDNEIKVTPLSEIYRSFESLGNNCEFGIVQRRAGFDPPGLFRNVGFLDVEQMIGAISRQFGGMFETGNFEFNLPDGWTDWRLDCRRFGFGFHSTIPSTIARDSPEWETAVERILKLFVFMKRKILDDLSSGDKVFVFRTLQRLTDKEINSLHAAVQMHGPTALLVVTSDKTRQAGGLQFCGNGLILGHMQQLSNENPPIIDFDAWESMCRNIAKSAAEIWNGAQTVIVPDGLAKAITAPGNHSAVTTHVLNGTSDEPRNVFSVDCDGIKAGLLMSVAAWIFLPLEFFGSEVGLVLHGYRSEKFSQADVNKKGRWQRISVSAFIPVGHQRAVPTLKIANTATCTVYTAGWEFRLDEM